VRRVAVEAVLDSIGLSRRFCQYNLDVVPLEISHDEVDDENALARAKAGGVGMRNILLELI